MVIDLNTMEYMFMIQNVCLMRSIDTLMITEKTILYVMQNIWAYRDKYKLHDVTMPTDGVKNCYKKNVTQVSDRTPAKIHFHVKIDEYNMLYELYN